jgi:hypothetical protein
MDLAVAFLSLPRQACPIASENFAMSYRTRRKRGAQQGKDAHLRLPSLLMALAAARLVEMKFGHRAETHIGAGPEGLIAITCADKNLLRPVAALMGTVGPAIGHE